MRRPHVGLALIALVHSASAAAADEAAAPGSPEPTVQQVPRPQGRILNGHVFMPSATVPGALVTTSFASYLLAGLGSTTGAFTIGNRSFNGTYDYGAIGAILGYEHAFGQYFSARLSINDVIYSGINGESAFAVGTQMQFGATLGVTASMPVGDAFRVGVLLDAGSVPGLALTIGSGLRAIVDRCNQGNCTVGNGDIFSTRNATTIQPAVAANWAVSRALGVTGNVAYVHVSQDQNAGGTLTGDALSLGLASDFDFRAIGWVPVGLMVQFNWTAPFSGDAPSLQHVTDLGGGIFYTGRDNLALGVQLVARRFAVQPTVNVTWSTYITTVGLRYYW